MGTPTIATLSKLAVDDSTVTGISDFDSGSFQYEPLPGSSIGMIQSHVFNDGIRGTRSRSKERVRISQERIGGTLNFNLTPIELDQWLPRILGAVEATDVFALAETIPEFGVLIEGGGYKRFIYTGCRVARCTINGTQGGLINWSVDIEGETEVVSGTSFPGTVPAIDSAAPYIFSDVTYALSADVSAAEVKEFTIIIDNMLDTERFMNSVTRGQIPTLDRQVTVRMVVPFTADELDLYDQAIAGAAGTLTMTQGAASCQFAFANLKAPAETPPMLNKEESLLTLNMTAYKSGSTNELIVTNDSTP